MSGPQELPLGSRSPLGHRGLRSAAELAEGRPHGTRIRYIAGCRCDQCRRANTQYELERAKARKTGDWNGFVTADKARAHILALSAAGVGRSQVADASGVGRTAVAEIYAGTKTRIRARTERSLLKVTVAAAADGAYIDAAPTWRLLDELLRSGYTQARISQELGNKSSLQIGTKHCTARNAYDVERVHARLRRVPAGPTEKLLAAIREEGYRPDRIERLLHELAGRKGIPMPDLKVYGGWNRTSWIHAQAESLVRQLHDEINEEN